MSQTTPPKRKSSGVLRTLRARTQSATAHLTAEEDWDTEVPNIRLSRVFAIVLILHVVAVGGILAFQIMNPEAGEAESVATPASQGGAGAGPERIDQPAPSPGELKAFGPDVEGLQHYRVQSGDTPISIARRFQVNVADFKRINKLGAGQQLYPGLIVFLPNKTIDTTPEADVRQLLDGAPPAEVAAAARAVPADGGAPDTVPRPLRIDDEGVIQPAAARSEAPGSAGPAVDRADRPAGWSGNAPAAAEPAPRPEVVRPAPAPAPAPEPAPTPEPSPSPASVAEFKDYEVQPGDTAFGLGRKFGVKPDALLRLNGIDDPTKLRAGTVIRIPVRD